MSGPQPHHSEILIVGAGVFGTSTAYHLSLSHHDPSKVTVIDRAPFPSPQAASSDINKIVRADYSIPFYMDLAYEAMDAFASMPILKNADVYHQTGWVMLDEKSSTLAMQIRENFRKSGREDVTRDLTLDEVKTSWGGVFGQMDTQNFEKAYVNPSAGWADASRAVEVMMEDAVGRGVRYEVGETDRLVLNERGVAGVQTADGRLFSADKVILATGAWTSKILSSSEDELSIKEADSVERQVTAAGVCVGIFNLSPEEAARYQHAVVIYGGKGMTILLFRSELPDGQYHIY